MWLREAFCLLVVECMGAFGHVVSGLFSFVIDTLVRLKTCPWWMSIPPTIMWITCWGSSCLFFLLASLSLKWFLALSLRNSRRWPSLNNRATSSLNCMQSSVLCPCVPWYLHIKLGFFWEGPVCIGLGYLVSLILPIAVMIPEASTLKLYSNNRGASAGSICLSNPFLLMSPRGFFPRSILWSFQDELRPEPLFLRFAVCGWYRYVFDFASLSISFGAFTANLFG